MQKYYHKGAFYVDDDSVRSKDDVRKRDATEATLEDKFNKEMLPTVMQVKNFGRAGRYGTCAKTCSVHPLIISILTALRAFNVVYNQNLQHEVYASGRPRHVQSGLVVDPERQHPRKVQESPWWYEGYRWVDEATEKRVTLRTGD